MLQVNQLQVGYGESDVVHQVSLQVAAGESVALMGRNGMGKTTLLKALIGMLPAKSGDITLAGVSLGGLPSYQRVRRGMAFVPQGRMIFPQLTVFVVFAFFFLTVFLFLWAFNPRKLKANRRNSIFLILLIVIVHLGTVLNLEFLFISVRVNKGFQQE